MPRGGPTRLFVIEDGRAHKIDFSGPDT